MILREPTVEDQTATRKIVAVLTAVITTALVALVMVFVSIKINQKPEPELIAKVIPKTVDEKPKMKKVSVSKMAKLASSAAAAGMSSKMIRAETTAVISAPKISQVNTGPLGLGDGDFGDGFGNGSGNGMGSGGLGSMKGIGKRVAGMTIEAETLGVILDVSGSMTDHLEKLRKEIKKEFKEAVFLEVTGCRLDASGGSFDIEEALTDLTDPKRPSVIVAMRELSEIHKVDAIFWFSDLNDGETEAGLAELESSLWRGNAPVRKTKEKSEFSGLDALKKMQSDSEMEAVKKENQPCRLYIRSVGNRAEKPLRDIVRDSGGSAKRA